MIEGADLDARVVRGVQKAVTGTKTSADNSQFVIPLLLQPVEAAAQIDHALTRGVKSATNVGRYREVGAANLRRTANVVIWHAQPQHRNAQAVQNAAE